MSSLREDAQEKHIQFLQKVRSLIHKYIYKKKTEIMARKNNCPINGHDEVGNAIK